MTDQVVTFQGWSKTYRIAQPEPYRIVIRKYCKVEKYNIGGTQVIGISLSWAGTVLRNEGYRVPHLAVDREAMFKALGFGVASGRNRYNKKCVVVHI